MAGGSASKIYVFHVFLSSASLNLLGLMYLVFMWSDDQVFRGILWDNHAIGSVC